MRWDYDSQVERTMTKRNVDQDGDCDDYDYDNDDNDNNDDSEDNTAIVKRTT